MTQTARTGPAVAAGLTPRQKAAVIVRLLLDGGAVPALARLDAGAQTALAQTMAAMQRVDRDTLRAVLGEFLAALEATGVVLPGGLDQTLALLDGQISAQAVDRLRGATPPAEDPWIDIARLPAGVLAALIADEHPAVGAVVLSQVPTEQAAGILGALPGPQARAIALALPGTDRTQPEVAARIGRALRAGQGARAPRAFAGDPAERFGAILNHTPDETRNALLDGLERDAAPFAGAVRRNLFTFAQLPDRVEQRDVPRAVRAVPPDVLLPALIHGRANAAHTSDFLLRNMPTRLAEQTRAEMAEHPPVAAAAGEAAQVRLAEAIRALGDSGEIGLIPPEDAPA